MRPIMKKKTSSQRRWAFHGQVVAISLLAVFGVISVVLGGGSRSPDTTTTTTTNNSKASFDLSPQRPPVQPLERRKINDIDVLLQRPRDELRGILFVGHGCSHSHTDWWPSTPDVCPECIGLPEEQAIVHMALHEFKLMVVAISSQNRMSKCWSHGDAPRVAQVLKQLWDEYATSNIPIVAFGASSGGGFVGSALVSSMLKLKQPLDGFIAQIAAPKPTWLDDAANNNYPVATYITMNRDRRTDHAANDIADSLIHDHHIPAKQIRVDSLPVVESFFHDRIQGYTVEESKNMVAALKAAQYLDPQTNALLEDPRQSDWRTVLRPLVPEIRDSFVADESPISEVLNAAQGRHEMTRDGVREAINFILQSLHEKKSKGSSTQ